MTGKLMFVPDDYVVVPRDPTEEMKQAAYRLEDTFLEGTWPTASEYWEALTKTAPQLTTPPVLRWSGDSLLFEKSRIARTREWVPGRWEWEAWGYPIVESFNSEQEARRAAEKALGFPDGLVVEEA